MKRTLVLLAALVLAATAFAQRDYENVDPTGQTVTFWHQHSGIRQDMLVEIVDAFNTTNPYGITVIEENQGGYGDIFNKMLVLLGTDETPDLVVAYQNQAATYQVVDGLIDMWPLVRSEKWGYSEEELADFFPGFLQSDVNPTFGNALLGFPPNRSMEMLYYNISWLEELGYDGPPTTPEEFAEMPARPSSSRTPARPAAAAASATRSRSTPAASPAGPSPSAATSSTTRPTASRSTPTPPWPP